MHNICNIFSPFYCTHYYCWLELSYFRLICLILSPPILSPFARGGCDFKPDIICDKISSSVIITALFLFFSSYRSRLVESWRYFYFLYLRCDFGYSCEISLSKSLTEDDFGNSKSFYIEFYFLLISSLSADAWFFWPPQDVEKSSELLKPVFLLLLPRLPLLPRPRPLPDDRVASFVFPPE